MSDQRPDEDRGAHRPQVIDLDAEEIRTEAEAPKPEGPQAATADETPPPPFKPVRRLNRMSTCCDLCSFAT